MIIIKKTRYSLHLKKKKKKEQQRRKTTSFGSKGEKHTMYIVPSKWLTLTSGKIGKAKYCNNVDYHNNNMTSLCVVAQFNGSEIIMKAYSL